MRGIDRGCDGGGAGGGRDLRLSRMVSFLDQLLPRTEDGGETSMRLQPSAGVDCWPEDEVEMDTCIPLRGCVGMIGTTAFFLHGRK